MANAEFEAERSLTHGPTPVLCPRLIVGRSHQPVRQFKGEPHLLNAMLMAGKPQMQCIAFSRLWTAAQVGITGRRLASTAARRISASVHCRSVAA
jgi:hypothetical protein